MPIVGGGMHDSDCDSDVIWSIEFHVISIFNYSIYNLISTFMVIIILSVITKSNSFPAFKIPSITCTDISVS